MKGYNTNLASEYYVLSTLYRLGFDAFITLGNKKSIDIILSLDNGRQVTIDVKGLQGKTLFPLDNLNENLKKENHFIVFLSFLDKMSDPSVQPEIYIVPYKAVSGLMYHSPNKKRKGINLSALRKSGKKYQDWNVLKK